jgi:hypothetical protein
MFNSESQTTKEMEEKQVRKVVQVGSWLVEVSLGFPGSSSGAAAAEGHAERGRAHRPSVQS